MFFTSRKELSNVRNICKTRAANLMNIKLSQIYGASGIKMIKAAIESLRDKDYLLCLCDQSIIAGKSELVLKALEGNYKRDLFVSAKREFKDVGIV